MNQIIIVGGPTATGKTKFALDLANKFKGELINADSRQLYKSLNIGTNKGEILTSNGSKFLEGIRIHKIDFLELDSIYSVYEWQLESKKIINDIFSRGLQPIIVGGTGLYIDSLIKEYKFQNLYKISKDKKDLLAQIGYENLETLQKFLIGEFPEIWNSLNYSDQNNIRRIERVLSKMKQSLVEDEENSIETNAPFKNYTFYYPNYNWEDLKHSIEKRVEEMFKLGFVDEVKSILSYTSELSSPGLNVVGYKEVVKYLSKEINLETCKTLIKTAHKQYARRQRTWFEGAGRGYNLNIVDFKNNL